MDKYNKQVEALRKKTATAIDKAVDALSAATRTAEEWQDFAFGPFKGEALAVAGMLKSAATKTAQAAVRAKSARTLLLAVAFATLLGCARPGHFEHWYPGDTELSKLMEVQKELEANGWHDIGMAVYEGSILVTAKRDK